MTRREDRESAYEILQKRTAERVRGRDQAGAGRPKTGTAKKKRRRFDWTRHGTRSGSRWAEAARDDTPTGDEIRRHARQEPRRQAGRGARPVDRARRARRHPAALSSKSGSGAGMASPRAVGYRHPCSRLTASRSGSGGHLILDRASAALPPKARVGLVGRNGAGKSTLLEADRRGPRGRRRAASRRRPARASAMSRRKRRAATATPFETVLAADTERARAAGRSRARPRPAPHRRDPRAAQRDRRAWRAGARRRASSPGSASPRRRSIEPLDSFSGGWRMRVALAALLFSEPDLLLLDEPSNHLDLEAARLARVLPQDLSRQPHRRQPRARSAQQRRRSHPASASAASSRSIPATTTRSSGSAASARRRPRRMRAKQEAKAQEAAGLCRSLALQGAHRAPGAEPPEGAGADGADRRRRREDASVVFDFPSPKELKPPLIVLDGRRGRLRGRTSRCCRASICASIPTTASRWSAATATARRRLARLLAGQLKPMAGALVASGKLQVGYFAQHQIEELVADETPLQHMERLLPGAKPGAVRAQLGRFGFSGDKANVAVRQLSGGERARLSLALITRDAPHILILDEPTNHLDVDAREALVAGADRLSSGAVVVVSHDRHLLGLIADRLVLVDDGTARRSTAASTTIATWCWASGQGGAEDGRKSAKRGRQARAAPGGRGARAPPGLAQAAVASRGRAEPAVAAARRDRRAARRAAANGGASVSELMKTRAEIERQPRQRRASLARSERSRRTR